MTLDYLSRPLCLRSGHEVMCLVTTTCLISFFEHLHMCRTLFAAWLILFVHEACVYEEKLVVRVSFPEFCFRPLGT